MSLTHKITCTNGCVTVVCTLEQEFPDDWMRVGDQYLCEKCAEKLYMEAVGATEPEDKDVTVSHRGYEIHVAAEGIEYKSYYVMRESDGWFIRDGFEYNGESVAEMIKGWKEFVDRELEADDPFDEKWEDEQMEEKGWHKVPGGWSNVPSV